jgi:hypothetical protein
MTGTEISVGVSPMEDRVVLCVGEERLGLPVEEAMRFAKLIMDACQQLIDAGKEKQPVQ